MSFSLREIQRAVLGGHLSITSDTAGFLILAVAEQSHERIDLDTIWLEDSGSLTVEPGDDDLPLISGLRCLLGDLLQGALADSPGLRHCANGDASTREQWIASLHAALIPLNRSAARRALRRLHRRLEQLGQETLTHVGQETLTHDDERLEHEAAPFQTTQSTLAVPLDPTELRPFLPTPACGPVEPRALRDHLLGRGVGVHQERRGERERQTWDLTPVLGSLPVHWSRTGLPNLERVHRETWTTDNQLDSDQPAAHPAPIPPHGCGELSSESSLLSSDHGLQPEAREQTFEKSGIEAQVGSPGDAQPSRRSRVKELVSSFGATETRSQAQLVEALRNSIERQATPLPGRVVPRPGEPGASSAKDCH